jgi:hypothetical protein
MRHSLSHRYRQFQSLIQLGAISFFDDRSQVGAGRVPHFWPVLPEVGISFDFSVSEMETCWIRPERDPSFLSALSAVPLSELCG